MENTETIGLSREFLGIDDDGSKYTVLNDTFVRGNDGHVYFHELTYQNEVVDTPAVNSAGQIVNYDYYFCNPFQYILASDFTHVEGNTYTLAQNKASFLSTKLFNAFDICFDEVITSVNCTFENNEKREYQKGIKLEDIIKDIKGEYEFDIIYGKYIIIEHSKDFYT